MRTRQNEEEAILPQRIARRGVPRTDLERVMNHYGIDRATAEYWLTIHPIDELLPERGTGREGYND